MGYLYVRIFKKLIHNFLFIFIASKDSDYDLLIVGVEGTTENYSKQKGLESFSTHWKNGNYDISLMDLSIYKNRIAKYRNFILLFPY